MVIRSILYYPNGTIRVEGITVPGIPMNCSTRGGISKFSLKSRARLGFVVSESTIELVSMLTLTFPREYSLNGKEIKEKLRRMLSYMSGQLFEGFEYVWVLEFQDRGAPHFHILTNVVPDNRDRALVALEWSYIVGGRDQDNVFYVHNREDTFSKIRKKDGAKRYMLKYLSKDNQKVIPERYTDVGRFWGVSTGVKRSIPSPKRLCMGEGELRDFLEGSGNPVARWEHLPIYIFSRQIVSRETI